MWITFPIGRHARIIIPWFLAIPLIPIAAGVWVLSLTVDAIRWAWRSIRPPRKPRQRDDQDSIRITVTRP